MGVPNYVDYKVSAHAVMRYAERINDQHDFVKVEKNIRFFLSQATKLSGKFEGGDAWAYKPKNIVLIIDPLNFKVVTLFEELKEGDRNRKVELNSREKAKRVISEYAKELIISESRNHYKEINELYAEYADKTDKLSRTFKPEYFKSNQREAEDTRKKIRSIEDEHEKYLDELENYTA